MNPKLFIPLLVIALASCQPKPTLTPRPTASPTSTPRHIVPGPRSNEQPQVIATVTPKPTDTKAPVIATETEEITSTPVSDDWMSLPVLPEPGDNLRVIYERGQSLGNDPNSFSIFGDCQARPEEFFGLFETDSAVFESLSPELRETVTYFSGSFNRESPTAQDGTTPGALLWSQWHRGEFGCSFNETPVECELRSHRPSFVLIQIGTHFESRNTEYLRKIISQLIENGVVPILATKADNRELDNRVNRDMALLADEFNLPLWNFWAALSDIPDRGLYVYEGREEQGAVYLDEDAQSIHRLTGLEALNVVWRKATGN